LLMGERSLGALNLMRRQFSDWHDVNLPLLQQIAGTLAIAIENSELWSRLREQARRDSLTQVLNHGTLIADLHIAFAQCSQHNEPLSFIMLDIDNFKQYNDTYGHVVGDLVLTKITRTIQDQLRPGDLVGRWGGEEFSVVLPNTAQNTAFEIAEQIRCALAGIPIHDRRGQNLPAPTVSQGIASIPESALTVEDLIEQADRAVYRAKNQGKNKLAAAEKFTP
jgi:diguanylate cyclase (GGDEF)-like protein